ncbi:hypothetical protein [Methylocapsa acidiphila]|uniref:hypothetical protein n=1 Tax=Methylocapsa acidiphila TaxID=133552 RepID=UPI0012EC9A50|nr:hypothetical protein [Methylocapsa acidiphila]
MASEIRSSAELQAVCLQALKKCRGFELVHEVLVQPRENAVGRANWTLAAVRPRVANDVLREARAVIAGLQESYLLNISESPDPKAAPRR